MTAGRGGDVGRWLDELDAAREAGTYPDEWGVRVEESPNNVFVPRVGFVAYAHRTADAALIVAAVNNLPRLVQITRAVEALCVRAETTGTQTPAAMPSGEPYPAAVKVDDLRAELTAAMGEGAT